MPTRIKPDRVGYSGYDCVGIDRPCIDQMDGVKNRFECLPKQTRKAVTDVPFEDMTAIVDDPLIQSAIYTGGTHFDPQDDGLFVDLYNAFRRAGLDTYLNYDCIYPYKRNDQCPPETSSDFPLEAESRQQVMYNPGYMEPIVEPFPYIGDGCGGVCDEESSSSGYSSEYSSEEPSSEPPPSSEEPPSSEPPPSESPPSEEPPSEPPSEIPPSEVPPSPGCGIRIEVVTHVWWDADYGKLYQQKTPIWVNCVDEPLPAEEVFSTTDCE